MASTIMFDEQTFSFESRNIPIIRIFFNLKLKVFKSGDRGGVSPAPRNILKPPMVPLIVRILKHFVRIRTDIALIGCKRISRTLPRRREGGGWRDVRDFRDINE